MATISFSRSAHQRPNPHLHCGKGKAPVHPARISSAYLEPTDYAALNRAVDLIRKAQLASSHASCMVNLTGALALLRDTTANNR